MTAIALPTVVDLAATVALAETLRTATGIVAIDGGRVERIGAAGIQLLLSARATAMAGGHALTIAPASAPLAAAVSTAGASVLLASDR